MGKYKIDKLPKTTGVYFFYKKKEIVYIGKAINIKDRVKNHFFQPTYKDNFFIGKTTSIGFVETGSEIEALVLEANLIKKHQPKFNQIWRDDKNYFYVAIEKNKQNIPFAYITHQPNKFKSPAFGEARPLGWQNTKYEIRHLGPFTEGNALKKTLKYLRKVFPFYASAKHPDKKCTWCHLALCPGPAPDLAEYKKNIKKLVLILRGKRKTVLYALKKEMAAASAQNKFEEAVKVRDKILALEQVMAHTNVLGNSRSQVTNHNLVNEKWMKTETVLQEILQVKTPISKIECYDISNIQGTQAVGSMVVFVNGRPDKSQYKKFRIRMENKPNDIAMLNEVLMRRLAHPEWGYPEVILIDGGIAQLNVGIKAKNNSLTNPTAVKNVSLLKNIKIISIAKGKQELLVEGQKEHILLKNLPQEIYNLIVHLDDEAHRFAITYHKKLRKKYLLT